jgi:hypothetical protein
LFFEKIALAMVGKCTNKTKTIKHLDIDVPALDWNVNEMSTKSNKILIFLQSHSQILIFVKNNSRAFFLSCSF